MKTIAVLIVLMMLTALASCLWSQQSASNTQATPKTDEKPVTLVLKDTPLPAAMTALFKGTGLSYSFAKLPGEVDGNEWWSKITVSVNINNVPFRDAIQIVARAAGLFVTVQNKTNLKDLINKDGKQADSFNYYFGPSMQSSNQMINKSQTQWTSSNTQMPQVSQSYSQNILSNAGPIKMAAKDGKGGKLLSVQLEQANVFDVISQLMSIYKKDYILDMGPSAELFEIAPRVTARMSAVSLEEFLAMLKSSSGIQIEDKDGQMIFRWRPDPKAILALAPANKAYTVYYLYLLVDANPNINSVLSSLEDGPALSRGNTEYVNWLREKAGFESTKILIAGSAANINTQSSSQQTNALRNVPLLSIRVGPVTIDGMEFKANLYAQTTTRSTLATKVRLALADRLYWRQSGKLGDNKSVGEKVVQWPTDRTYLVRSDKITWPNGSNRLFILVASVSPVNAQDLWPTSNSK